MGQESAKTPVVSPDGRYIVFLSNRAGALNLWRMNLDGSDLKQLTTGARDLIPVFAPDGRLIIYESLVDNRAVFYKVSIEGGAPDQIGETNMSNSLLALSPDGKRLAYWRIDEATKKEQTVIRSLDDGAILQEMDLIGRYNLQFSTDGSSLLLGWRLVPEGRVKSGSADN